MAFSERGVSHGQRIETKIETDRHRRNAARKALERGREGQGGEPVPGLVDPQEEFLRVPGGAVGAWRADQSGHLIRPASSLSDFFKAPRELCGIPVRLPVPDLLIQVVDFRILSESGGSLDESAVYMSRQVVDFSVNGLTVNGQLLVIQNFNFSAGGEPPGGDAPGAAGEVVGTGGLELLGDGGDGVVARFFNLNPVAVGVRDGHFQFPGMNERRSP